jgi:hypothetical protein
MVGPPLGQAAAQPSGIATLTAAHETIEKANIKITVKMNDFISELIIHN